MEEIIKCKNCDKLFKVLKTGKKRSNGSWERKYISNQVIVLKLVCYSCYREYQSNTWQVRKPSAVAYEKTKKGFLMRVYRNMKSRIEGVQKKKYHLYRGKSLLNKEDFYNWALQSEEFHKLFKEWETSKYERRLTPSVDRIDPSKGYEVSNMEWVTHSENSRRSSTTRRS